MAGAVSYGWLGGIEGKGAGGTSEEDHGSADGVVVEDNHTVQPVAASLRVRALDAADGAGAAVGGIPAAVESCQRKPVVGAVGVDVPTTTVSGVRTGPQASEVWLTTEYPAIQKLALQEGATIYFGDESGVRSDYHAGTTWGARGRTPVVPTTGSRVSVNMLSAITAKGEMRFMVTTGKVNAERFIDFLKRLLVHAEAPVFLILDGHPVHRSRVVTGFVKSTAGRLRIFLLPGYAPELNPDEQVWNHVKNHDIGRASIPSRPDLLRRVQRRLYSLQRQPHLIRSFFELPATRYAAA